MEQVKWFNRAFDFTSDQNIFPSIAERLAGTPARLEEKFTLINPDILSVRIDGTWTIKENLGHLTDLEPLWQGRLDDIINGREELRPTDLQNTRTSQAHHDAVPIEQLLSSFRQVRNQTLHLLENVTTEQVFKSALHPRLKTPMRTMDLFLFVAEHDDHHLARITELVRLINGRSN
ncbi:MAG: DinB family protein [Williamsia sp.]|nr:DinB family protein [Williamsia sp.]